MASKQWTLTRPDGKCWAGETPLKCVMAEVNDRVPASVQLERIYGAVEKSRADDERLCRETYDNTFHKITASIGYDDWRMVWFKALESIDGTESPPAQAPAATEPSNPGYWEVVSALRVALHGLPKPHAAAINGLAVLDKLKNRAPAATEAPSEWKKRADELDTDTGDDGTGWHSRGMAQGIRWCIESLATPAPAVGASDWQAKRDLMDRLDARDAGAPAVSASVQPVPASLSDEQMAAIEAYARALVTVDFWSGKVLASVTIDKAIAAREAMKAALATTSSAASEVKP